MRVQLIQASTFILLLLLYGVWSVDRIAEDTQVLQTSPRGPLIQINKVTLQANGIESANSAVYLANVTLTSGEVVFGTVKFSPTKRQYQCNFKGVIPSDGEIVRLPLYTVLSTFQLNGTSTDPTQAQLSPMGRELLKLFDTFSWTQFGCNALLSVPGSTGGPIAIVGAVAGSALAASDSDCGSGGITAAQLQDSFNHLDTYLDSVQIALTQTVVVLHTVQAETDQLITFRSQVEDWQNVTNARLNRTDERMTNLEDSFKNFAIQVSDDINVFNQSLTNTNAELLQTNTELHDIAVTFGQAFADVLSKMFNITGALNSLSQQTGTEFNRMHQQEARHMAVIGENFDIFSTIIGNILTQQPKYQKLAQGFWQSVQDVLSKGFVPFLSDMGSSSAADPFNLDPSLAFRPMAIVAYQGIYVRSGGVPVASVITLVLKCSTVFLTLNSQPLSSFTALLANIGGRPGCSTTDQRTACSCWIAVEEDICDVKPGTNSPNAGAITYWKTSPPVLDSNICNAASTPGSFDGRIITNATDFFNFEADICNRGAYSGYEQYNVWSNLRAGYFTVPYMTAACTKDIGTLMYPDATDLNSFSIVYMTGVYMMDSYEFRMQNISAWSTEIWGELANDITWNPDTPFRRLQRGVMGSKLEAAYMAFPPIDFSIDQNGGMLPVCEWQFLEDITTVDVTINGVTTTYDATATNDFASDLLPKTGDSFVGDPKKVFSLASPLINFLPDELVWTKNVRGNCGKPVYNLVSSAQQFSNANWTDFMKATGYDAECGSNVASNAIQAISSLDHRCPGGISTGTGTWCNILDRFDFTVDVNTGIVTFISRSDDVTSVTVNFPPGQIEGLVGSSCPAISKLKNSTSSDILLLTNPLSVPNRIKIIQTGGCPRVYGPFDIAPFQTENVTLPYCPTPLVGQSDILTIYIEADPTIGFVACNGTVNADVTNQLQSTPFAGSQIYIDERDATITDGSLVAIAAVLQNNAILFIDNKVSTFRTLALSGLASDDIKRQIADEIAAINQTHSGILDNMQFLATQLTGNLSAIISSFSDAAAQFRQDIAQYASQADGILNQETANDNTVKALQALAHQGLDNLTADVADAKQKLADWEDYVKHLTDPTGLSPNAFADFLSFITNYLDLFKWPALIFAFLGGLLGQIMAWIAAALIFPFFYSPIIWWWINYWDIVLLCRCSKCKMDPSGNKTVTNTYITTQPTPAYTPQYATPAPPRPSAPSLPREGPDFTPAGNIEHDGTAVGDDFPLLQLSDPPRNTLFTSKAY